MSELRKKKIYAIYDGDEFVDVGTAEELAKRQKYSITYISRKAQEFELFGEITYRYIFLVHEELDEIIYGDWIESSDKIHYLVKRSDGSTSTLCECRLSEYSFIDELDLINNKESICRTCLDYYEEIK